MRSCADRRRLIATVRGMPALLTIDRAGMPFWLTANAHGLRDALRKWSPLTVAIEDCMMSDSRFDRLTRRLSATPTRRGVLLGLAASLGLAVTRMPRAVTAKNKHKKKLKRNQYGCVDAGGNCQGRDNVCCSGICDGKKPKKGKKDRSRCVAHHEGACTLAQDSCANDDPTPCHPDLPYFCLRTTGKAAYCGWNPAPACLTCRNDADCEQTLGPDAACVVCPSCPGSAETMCVLPGTD